MNPLSSTSSMGEVDQVDGSEVSTSVGEGSQNLHWYALRVRSRYERIVEKFLGNEGYELFLPTYRSRRCWSDRIKELELPLFPGYVFSRFDIHRRLPILMIPGVQHIVGGTVVPRPIDPLEIDALQRVVEAGVPREPWPFLQLGDRLRIERGSLAGAEGILLQVRGRHRLVLSITLLQRSVSVDIDSAFVSVLSREMGGESPRADLGSIRYNGHKSVPS